eukprot:2666731-Pleurochrysis_carterae.AAC.2
MARLASPRAMSARTGSHMETTMDALLLPLAGSRSKELESTSSHVSVSKLPKTTTTSLLVRFSCAHAQPQRAGFKKRRGAGEGIVARRNPLLAARLAEAVRHEHGEVLVELDRVVVKGDAHHRRVQVAQLVGTVLRTHTRARGQSEGRRRVGAAGCTMHAANGKTTSKVHVARGKRRNRRRDRRRCVRPVPGNTLVLLAQALLAKLGLDPKPPATWSRLIFCAEYRNT